MMYRVSDKDGFEIYGYQTESKDNMTILSLLVFREMLEFF